MIQYYGLCFVTGDLCEVTVQPESVKSRCFEKVELCQGATYMNQ